MMIPQSNLHKMMPTERMVGEDDEDTELLHEMLERATAYITGFHWCPPIEEIYLGAGVGGVVAVLFRFEHKIEDTDDCLWVVVGDFPSAYLVIDNALDPVTAVEGYCELMEDWISAVRGEKPLDNKVFPVTAAPTVEHADMLDSRIDWLRKYILPRWREEWNQKTH